VRGELRRFVASELARRGQGGQFAPVVVS
jgi:hypothetical protein